MKENKSLFQEFERCFFCQKEVWTPGAEFMFQGRPVCYECQQKRRYVALLCTPIKQFLGIDSNWKSQVNPNKKNTAHRR